jgi:hypothetical protein
VCVYPPGKNKRKERTKMKYCIILVAGLLPYSCLSASELLDGLKLEPSARWRYQEVEDEYRGDAQANTLKLRLSADWQLSNNWQAFTQFDYVHAFDEAQYNSVAIARATSPIPDPPGPDLNQLYIKYQSDTNWSLALGRQAVGLDNERHVGSVEFWQNEQTLDALRFDYKDNLNWTVNYLYVDKVKRIFGDRSEAFLPHDDIRFETDPLRPINELGEHQHDSHLINMRYVINHQAKLSLYAYLLYNHSAPTLSSDTYGARLVGDFKPQRIKYSYTIEYALQSTSHDNPWQYSTDYLLLEANMQINSHQFSLSYEKFGEDNDFGFVTSLGTNHKFQGWADVFSTYAKGGGLQDFYLTYKGRDAKLRWRVMAHHFSGDSLSTQVGNEIDLELAYRYNRDWEFKFIAARYVADEGLSYVSASQHNLSTWMISAAYKL